MEVEVWQRPDDTQTDSFIGTAKLPLHQFYIAFHDINVRHHVAKQKVCTQMLAISLLSKIINFNFV